MIILASKSASRRAMLEAAGVAHEASPADLNERALEASLTDSDPSEVALTLARAKAAALAGRHPGRIILGSDSLVTVDGKRFDKPADRAAAAQHLRFFSGRTMYLHSAAALVRCGETLWHHADMAELKVRELSDGFIESYLAAEWPEVSHCVGVFRIEARGVQLFESIKGDQFTILGMPLLPLLGALRDLGELPS